MSVIIPVLDAWDTLPEQLDALARQTYERPWEVIVADNGSVDRLEPMLEPWASRLPSVRVVDASDRKGQGHARNAGAAEAKGDFIAFCDADDVATPAWLEEMAKMARSCDIVGGAVEVDTLNDPIMLAWRKPKLQDGLGVTQGFLPWAMSANLGIWSHVFNELDGFNEEYSTGEDVELSWRAQLASYRLSYAPAALMYYRYRGGLRGLASQFYRYGLGGTRLYRDFRIYGMRNPGIRMIAAWGGLLIHLGDLLVHKRRGAWVRKAAYRWGRLRGSIRHRVLYF